MGSDRARCSIYRSSWLFPACKDVTGETLSKSHFEVSAGFHFLAVPLPTAFSWACVLARSWRYFHKLGIGFLGSPARADISISARTYSRKS
jgi:hypothetical protein